MAKHQFTSRARTIPIMGKQPKLSAGAIERPIETPNLTRGSAEPFSFPTARSLMAPQTYDSVIPRRVVEAELDELLQWAMPRLLQRWPRCTPESVRPMLLIATRGGRYCFLRTSVACALFVADRTWCEPDLVVESKFIISKPSSGMGGTGRTRDGAEVGDLGTAPAHYRAVKLELPNLYKAGKKWAEDVGAVSYTYEQSTGSEIEPIAGEIGSDSSFSVHTVALNKPIEIAAE